MGVEKIVWNVLLDVFKLLFLVIKLLLLFNIFRLILLVRFCSVIFEFKGVLIVSLYKFSLFKLFIVFEWVIGVWGNRVFNWIILLILLLLLVVMC